MFVVGGLVTSNKLVKMIILYHISHVNTLTDYDHLFYMQIRSKT